MERKDYLTTGELTQLMGITKHTLFHYDDIGLFQPKYINEKGYRFYSIDQIDILNTILVLRDLDMPLKEIQTYVSQRTPELFQQRSIILCILKPFRLQSRLRNYNP